MIAIAVTIATTVILIVGNVLAVGPTDNTRPGFGLGDQNHDHTGPPGGPSVHPVHAEVSVNNNVSIQANTGSQ